MRLFAITAFVCGLVLPYHLQSAEMLAVVPLTSPTQSVLTAKTLGVIANSNDSDSVQLANSYLQAHDIPLSNLILLDLPKANFVNRKTFEREMAKLRRSPAYDTFVGYALAFDRPYRVDANQSITAAIAQGISETRFVGDCNMTTRNPDYSDNPGRALTLRPAMLLSGGGGLPDALALVQRGRAANVSDPDGEVLLVKTSDRNRSRPREDSIDRAAARFVGRVRVASTTSGPTFSSRMIVGFQTGQAIVNDLHRLKFQPGAYADALTSFGGALNDNKHQTTVAELIRAGATGAYGTVREPCNYAGKFPDPEYMLKNYLHGDTLLEAYWKSVAMVTEGLFIGDPLTRPFPLLQALSDNGELTLRINQNTASYISEVINARTPDVAEPHPVASLTLGVYFVETGTPRFVKDIQLSATEKVGDRIDTIPLGDGGHRDKMLGIVVR